MTGARADGRTTRWAGHREQRRAAFVDAAVAVIGRVGPSATVDQIAAGAGTSRQALYRQFSDRADLDHAVAERAAALLVEHLLPDLALPPAGLGDVERPIADGLRAYLDFVQQHLGLYRFVRSRELEVEAGSAVRQVKDTVADQIAGLAAPLLADLELAPGTATTFAVGMVGLVDAVISRWLDDPRGLTRDQLVAQLTLVLGGAARALAAAPR